MVAKRRPQQEAPFAMSGISGSSQTSSSLGGTPNIARMTLVYTSTKAITAAAGAVQDQVYTGNGCFDPDITGAGSQPANYDDWSTLYGRYRVRGSRLTYGVVSNGATTGTGVFYTALCARHVTTAITTPSGFDSAVSMPFSQWHPVGTSVGPIPMYTAAYSTAQVLGYKDSAIEDDDTLQALTSANPNHQWYWHILIRVSDDSSTGSGTFLVRIEYDVEFFDRLDTLLDLEHKLARDIDRLYLKRLRDEKSGDKTGIPSSVFAELKHEYEESVINPLDQKSDSPSRDIVLGSVLPRPILARSDTSVLVGGARKNATVQPRGKVVTQTELF
jgi:hypothetical protein